MDAELSRRAGAVAPYMGLSPAERLEFIRAVQATTSFDALDQKWRDLIEQTERAMTVDAPAQST